MTKPQTPLQTLEYCNWTFVECLRPSASWRVIRDCDPVNDDTDDESQGIKLAAGDSRNWKAYKASLQPQVQHRYPYPRPGAQCPKCRKEVNGVNPYDDGETWRK